MIVYTTALYYCFPLQKSFLKDVYICHFYLLSSTSLELTPVSSSPCGCENFCQGPQRLFFVARSNGQFSACLPTTTCIFTFFFGKHVLPWTAKLFSFGFLPISLAHPQSFLLSFPSSLASKYWCTPGSSLLMISNLCLWLWSPNLHIQLFDIASWASKRPLNLHTSSPHFLPQIYSVPRLIHLDKCQLYLYSCLG